MNRTYPPLRLRGIVLVSMLGLLASMLVSPSAIAVHGAAVPATAPNPTLNGSCGLNVALVIDTSNSVTDPVFPPFLGSPDNPPAIKAAANAFVDALTGTPTEIGVYSFRSEATHELGATDVRDDSGANTVKSAINAIDFYNPNVDGGTNWEAGFTAAASQGADLVAFITDGQPTVHTNNNDGVYQDDDLAAGVTAANAVKAAGTRVVAIGIGTGGGAASVANLQAISGATQDNDWYLTGNFSALATVLAELALELCGPSVSLVKMIDTGSGFVPAPGWQFNVSVDPAPTTPVVANPPDGVTDAAGAASFKWTSSGPTTVTVTEVVQDFFIYDSASCNNQTRSPLPVTPTTDGFTVSVGQFEIVTCEVFNVAAPPGLDLVKEASTQIAHVGDEVTYNYTATNTGGVVLDNLTLIDDVLGNITLGVTTLAPGESTTGTASHVVTAADLPGPIVNVATVSATDPQGAVLTYPDTETVDLAAIDIAKVVNTQSATVGDVLTYTYTVTNIGSVVLTGITVTDDQLGAISLATTTLAPGESTTGTATYTVVASDTNRFPLVNVADATGSDPDDRLVTDRAQAEVPVLVLQAVVTTTIAVAPVTLPPTGPTPQTGTGSALGMTLLLAGSLLVAAAAQRWRRLLATRAAVHHDPEATRWARTILGLPAINPAASDWARRMLGIKKRKVNLRIDR